MTPHAAFILAPICRDLVNKKDTSYMLGCVSGALDALEKLHHIDEPEYTRLNHLAGAHPQQLLAIIYNETFPFTA